MAAISRRGFLAATAALAAGDVAATPQRRPPPKPGALLRLNPADFDAVGDGASDDTAAWLRLAEAANTASARRQPVEIHISGRHAVSRTILLRPAGPSFEVIGKGGDTGFVATGDGRFDCLALRGGTTAGSPQAIAMAAPRGSTLLTLRQAEGIQQGDVLLVSNATGFEKDRRDCLVEVAAQQGNRLRLKRPLPFDIDPARTATVTRMSLARGVRVVNLAFNGRKAAGGAIGLNCTFLRDPFVESIRSAGFTRSLGTGQVYGPCLGGRFNNLSDTGSGWQGTSNSIKFVNITGAQITDVTVSQSMGFGIGITFVSDSRLGGLTSNGSAGRGLKLFGACHNEFTTLVVNNSGKTGLSISSGSSHNTFSGIEARGNKETGVWLNGTGNDGNRFTRVISTGNGVDLMVAATAPLIDRNNVFAGSLGGFEKLEIAPGTETVLQR